MPLVPRRLNLNLPFVVSEDDHRMLWQQCAHWAALQPDKHAIVTPQAAFTYSQLDQTINRVAAAVLGLRGTATGPMRALVFFADPFGQVASAIGIEKAGVCHVILNVASPPAFLEQIAADVEPALIITETSLADQARKLVGSEVPVVTIESLHGSDHVLAGQCTLDELHSLLYTSGSSGRPKGVMHSRHFEASAVARDMGSGLTLRDDKVLCAGALGSGMGRRVARNAMVVGATLYLPNMACDWATVARGWMDAAPITFLGTLPSVLRILFNAIEPDHRYEHLQIISIAGEAMRATDFELFKRHTFAGALLSNGYGASEGGIYSLGSLDRDAAVTTPTVPMGKALSFVDISVVDEQLQPLAHDQAGEMLIRSPMTASGYWKMPELTAKKFLPDPNGSRRRIFRTGDLGSISADGTITHLGRVDDEVKVNGNRVSLPMVENALLGCPGVENAVIRLHTRPGDGSTCLAAYYVASLNPIPSATALREHLRQRLPAYMIPTYFTRLDSIPVNATGKVDRFALPAPDEDERTSSQPLVVPRTDMEKQIAAIWGSILGVREIGVEDRFFDLGGDSLQAVKMLIQVNHTLGTALDLPALNQARTIAELASLISNNTDDGRHPPVTLLKEGKETPLFLFHAIGGTVWFYQRLADRLTCDRPIYGILAQGLNPDETPLARVPEIARHHIRRMKALQPQGPYHFGGYSFGGIVAYEVAQQLRATGEQVGLVFVLDARVHLPKTLNTLQRMRNTIWREARRLGHHLGYFATHRPSAWPAYARELLNRAHRVRHNADLRRRHEAGFHEQVDRYLAEVDQVASPTILAAIDAHHLALSFYRPIPYPGDVVVVLAHETNFEGLEAWKAPWREVVQGTVEFIEVPGNHQNMMYEPQVDVLAERLNSVLWRDGTEL